MSDPAPPVTASGAKSYPSLAALREAHGALLDRRRVQGETPKLLAAVEEFLRCGSATGTLLDASDDRRAAQSLLNYWANGLYRAGRESPDATLADFDPLLAPVLPDADCPYLGLDAFREADHVRFFGRRLLIDELVQRLGDQRLLAVVGPSGSGKSSLVLAGLIPALKAGALPGSQDWRYPPPLVPGSDPLANLLRRTLDVEVSPPPPDAATLLRTLGLSVRGQEPTIAEGRPTTADQRTTSDEERAPADGGSPIQTPIVLVVDQFEELFTLCDDQDKREAFVARLLKLVDSPLARHNVILTMRSDFETFIARVPALQARFGAARVQVTPLSATDLREAIEQPAAAVGLKFEQGVVELLLQDILGEPAGLPLLQFTLLKLWEQRERNRVTRAAYDRVGGGRLALARSADAFYNALIPEEQITARRILLRMVRPGEGLEITSSRIRRDTLAQSGEDPGRVERVLAKLIAARLVRLTPGETEADTQVEVAHEALVRNWPTLVEWLEQEKAAIAVRRRLDARAAEWQRRERGDAGLFDAVELREAERWLQSAEAAYLGYDPALPALVEASRFAIERAEQATMAQQIELATAKAVAEEQARANRRLRLFAVGLGVLLALAIAAAAFAVKQVTKVDSQRLAFAAEGQIPGESETALLLAYEAVERDDNPTTEQALRDVFDQAIIPTIMRGHTSGVFSAVFSPDGQRILTASNDGTARLWNLSGRLLATLDPHTGPIYRAVFSPDGKSILTASGDGTAQVWDLNGTPPVTLRGHTDWIQSAVFSPDGKSILTASNDGTARHWNLSGRLLAKLDKHTGPVYSAMFSPDGQRILTASYDGTARLWDANGAPLVTFQGHTGPIRSAVFSSDGQRILTASDDNTVRLWDVNGTPLITFEGHSWGGFTGAVFSPDGNRILTAGGDGTARLWDAGGNVVAILSEHKNTIFSAVFSPDGNRILTAGGDGTARLWDAGGTLLTTLRGDTAQVVSAVFSPDGKHILTASFDTTARLWDTSGTLQGHTVGVTSAVFSSDGQRILTASYDGTARLWDADGQPRTTFQEDAPVNGAVFSPDGQRILTALQDNTARVQDTKGKLLATLRGHTKEVTSAVFSPDGQRILTTSNDGTARLWDTSGTLLVTLQGHTDAVQSAAFSPDGQRILTASHDGTARLWDTSGTLLVTLHGEEIHSAVFSPDGQRILTASGDSMARVWDLNGTLLIKLQGHAGPVNTAVFSPDGQHILTGSSDHTARLWDADGTLLATLRGHTESVLDAVFSPDGKSILTASYDHTARLYLVNFSDILAAAPCRVGRGLTEDEIARFNVGMPRFDFARRQCPLNLGEGK